jgi:5S rRNA maturation endonuclease (ribonuclease M5)
VYTAEETYEELCQLLEDLRSLPSRVVILVEGPKDEACLRKLGVRSPIIRIHSSRPLHAELSPFDEVVILTDYDREGRRLARRSQETARSFGVTPNMQFRSEIRRITTGELSHVEGLYTYLRHLRAGLHPSEVRT